MQRIFKCCGIQNISFTSYKELNILIYRTLSYVIIWKSYTLLKMIQFFGPPCIIHEHESNLYSIFVPQIRSTILAPYKFLCMYFVVYSRFPPYENTSLDVRWSSLLISHAHKTLPAPSQTAPTSKHSPATAPSALSLEIVYGLFCTTTVKSYCRAAAL